MDRSKELKILYYLFILFGGGVLFFEQRKGDDANMFLLISSLALLMFGLYNVARNYRIKNKEYPESDGKKNLEKFHQNGQETTKKTQKDKEQKM